MKKKKSRINETGNTFEKLVHLPKGNPQYPPHTRFIEEGDTFVLVESAPTNVRQRLENDIADEFMSFIGEWDDPHTFKIGLIDRRIALLERMIQEEKDRYDLSVWGPGNMSPDNPEKLVKAKKQIALYETQKKEAEKWKKELQLPSKNYRSLPKLFINQEEYLEKSLQILRTANIIDSSDKFIPTKGNKGAFYYWFKEMEARGIIIPTNEPEYVHAIKFFFPGLSISTSTFRSKKPEVRKKFEVLFRSLFKLVKEA